MEDKTLVCEHVFLAYLKCLVVAFIVGVVCFFMLASLNEGAILIAGSIMFYGGKLFMLTTKALPALIGFGFLVDIHNNELQRPWVLIPFSIFTSYIVYFMYAG